MDRESMSEIGVLDITETAIGYLYKGVQYELAYHPYEPCLYLMNGDEYVVTLHNAFRTEEIRKVYSAGGSLRAIDGTFYDEKEFCKVLSTAIDRKYENVDFTYAAKKMREGS